MCVCRWGWAVGAGAGWGGCRLGKHLSPSSQIFMTSFAEVALCILPQVFQTIFRNNLWFTPLMYALFCDLHLILSFFFCDLPLILLIFLQNHKTYFFQQFSKGKKGHQILKKNISHLSFSWNFILFYIVFGIRKRFKIWCSIFSVSLFFFL